MTDTTADAVTTPTEERAILAGGCFWGLEELIRDMPGVFSTRVGYAGGQMANATYRNHGDHAEAVEIDFDPSQISYRELLEFFFQVHDPTTKNRQGNDVGTSYRSVILYLSDEQKAVAEETIAAIDASGRWPGPVVTEVEPAGEFWDAEEEHQDYLRKHPGGYTCHYLRTTIPAARSSALTSAGWRASSFSDIHRRVRGVAPFRTDLVRVELVDVDQGVARDGMARVHRAVDTGLVRDRLGQLVLDEDALPVPGSAVEVDRCMLRELFGHGAYSVSRLRQRIPALIKPSRSPSKTLLGLLTSYSVRRSLTIWYGART
jgi:peptide-methionine (S)-S-oxide reductase